MLVLYILPLPRSRPSLASRLKFSLRIIILPLPLKLFLLPSLPLSSFHPILPIAFSKGSFKLVLFGTAGLCIIQYVYSKLQARASQALPIPAFHIPVAPHPAPPLLNSSPSLEKLNSNLIFSTTASQNHIYQSIRINRQNGSVRYPRFPPYGCEP